MTQVIKTTVYKKWYKQNVKLLKMIQAKRKTIEIWYKQNKKTVEKWCKQNLKLLKNEISKIKTENDISKI